MSFEGFPHQLIDYLTELGTHNNRDWVQAHRDACGLCASTEQPTPEAVFTDQLPKICFERFQRVAPLQQWLVDLLAV
jgi:hypothetical protein